MRSFVLLILVLICTALNVACGKTGDLYLPDDSVTESESLEKVPDNIPSSETSSTKGR